MIVRLFIVSLLFYLTVLNGSGTATLCVPPMFLLPWPDPIPAEVQWQYKNELLPVKDTLSIVRSWNKTEDALRSKQRRIEQMLMGKLIDPELLKSMIDLKKLSIMCNTLTKFNKAKAITEQAISLSNNPTNPKDFDRLITLGGNNNLERIACDFLGHLDSPADVLESLVELLIPEMANSMAAKRDHEAISSLIGQLVNAKSIKSVSQRKKKK
ncbi:hypothetical protein TTRE_0000015301 [Trichuris trichiura]|uniref:Secreted protein n=1 Tax=Trichuris trichiura TaxID=36087 RepID=A0A077YVV4_TRITR|nr:hypothetical protein TTRE_0000015301 [Trichuris trichiura]